MISYRYFFAAKSNSKVGPQKQKKWETIIGLDQEKTEGFQVSRLVANFFHGSFIEPPLRSMKRRGRKLFFIQYHFSSGQGFGHLGNDEYSTPLLILVHCDWWKGIESYKAQKKGATNINYKSTLNLKIGWSVKRQTRTNFRPICVTGQDSDLKSFTTVTKMGPLERKKAASENWLTWTAWRRPRRGSSCQINLTNIWALLCYLLILHTR